MNPEAVVSAVVELASVSRYPSPAKLVVAANGEYAIATDSAIAVLWQTRKTYGMGNAVADRAIRKTLMYRDEAFASGNDGEQIEIPDLGGVGELNWWQCGNCGGAEVSERMGCHRCRNGFVALWDGSAIDDDDPGSVVFFRRASGERLGMRARYLQLASALGVRRMRPVPSNHGWIGEGFPGGVYGCLRYTVGLMPLDPDCRAMIRGAASPAIGEGSRASEIAGRLAAGKAGAP